MFGRRKQSVPTPKALDSPQALMAEFSVTDPEGLASALEQFTGVEESIQVLVEDSRLRCEFSGAVVMIDFPTTLTDVLQLFVSAEEDDGDTVSPRGYEDFDLFDR